jgi:hypothetical protein
MDREELQVRLNSSNKLVLNSIVTAAIGYGRFV